MTAHVLLNPAARGGRNRTLEPLLVTTLGAVGVDAEVWVTTAPGDARRRARALGEEGETVLVAGGDGTVHEVVSGLVGTDGTLGVLPLGTGNDYVRALGMSTDLEAAAAQIAAAPVRPVDVARVRWSDRRQHTREAVVANGLGIGFDAHVAKLAAETKWLGGQAAYLAAVLRTLWAWRKPSVEVRVSTEGGAAGLDYAGPLFLCEVGNGVSAGGGFLLTPDARLDDGLLDVCLVRHLPTRRALRLLPTTFSGAHVTAPEVRMGRVEALRLEVAVGGVALHADGEVLTYDASEVEVTVEPGALRVLAPAG